MRTLSRRQFLVVAGGILLASCTSAVSSAEPSASAPPDSPMAANAGLGVWPEAIARQPTAVREAYAYAAASPVSLRYIPCYCGCGAAGHRDNLSCYVQQSSRGGWVVLDPHAAACGVCVGITQDVMAMEKRGQSLKEIRRVVDERWSKAGPSTPTPMP